MTTPTTPSPMEAFEDLVAGLANRHTHPKAVIVRAALSNLEAQAAAGCAVSEANKDAEIEALRKELEDADEVELAHVQDVNRAVEQRNAAEDARDAATARAEALAARVDDLAMLVRQLVHSLRKANADNETAHRAADYLKRHDLQGSLLRTESKQPEELRCDQREHDARVRREALEEAWERMQRCTWGQAANTAFNDIRPHLEAALLGEAKPVSEANPATSPQAQPAEEKL